MEIVVYLKVHLLSVVRLFASFGCDFAEIQQEHAHRGNDRFGVRQNMSFAQNRGARGQKMICDINWRIRRFMTKMRSLQIESEVINYF